MGHGHFVGARRGGAQNMAGAPSVNDVYVVGGGAIGGNYNRRINIFRSGIIDVVAPCLDQVPLLVSNPCCVLDLVADFWWPGAGVVYFELDWSPLYPHLQQ